MLENGAGENDESLQEMANELGITFERVKAYIQSF
jgi:DNA-directed RNA polymerase sigma subunit (sigma70/sigma32)